MGVSGFFGKRNLEKIEIKIETPDEIFAKTPFFVRLTVMNKKRFLASLLLRIHVGDKEILFPIIERNSTKTKEFTYLCEKRGLNRLHPIYLSSVFPFNFFTRYKPIGKVKEFLVFPEPKKADIGSSSEGRDSKDPKYQSPYGFDDEILSLRDYVHGDPIKLVHWKASAKTGQLKIKNVASSHNHPIIIDFDRVPIEDIEERLKAVAYEIVEGRRNNRPVGLKINGRIYDPSYARDSTLTMLKELALYGQT
ncbi:MAG: DUF58 domain-containing protein [Deltaproteobacteria bacterium]|nr:DUF58 domain-containing protein [Deltaproteobacteria bacterium]